MGEFESDSGDESEEGQGGRGGRHGGRSHFGERKMYKAVCSDCGQECEVPFEPSAGRPVYCRDCFQKHRRPRRF